MKAGVFMADLIRPVDFSGLVQRSHDVSNTKQNEDNKPALDQQNIQQTFEKDVERASKEVIKKQDADYHQRKFDAKEKGRGQEYTKQNQKKKKKENEDKVIKKENNSHFDIKI